MRERIKRAASVSALLSAAAATIGFLAAPARCVADLWDNSSGDGQWSNPLNWQDDTEPDGTEEVFLPTNVPGPSSTITLSDGELAGGFFVQNNYTLTGGSITLIDPISPQITPTSTGSLTINSVIAGTNGIDKNQVGWLTLGGNNTFTGLVTIGGGRLRIDSDARLGNASNSVQISNGMLELLGGNMTINRAVAMNVDSDVRATSGTSSSLGMHTVASGIGVQFSTTFSTDVLNIGSRLNNAKVPINGGNGNASIAIRGLGTVRLGGTSCDFLGRWVLEAGTLDVGDDARLGNANNDVTLSGGTISFDGNGICFRDFAVNSGVFNVVNSALTLVGPTLSTSAGGGFTKTGLGFLRVFATQSYADGSVIDINQGGITEFAAAGSASTHPLRVNVNSSGEFQTNVTNYLQRLDVNDGGVARVGVEAADGALQVDTLNIAGTGRLDVEKFKLIVKSGNTNGTPTGTWNGSAYTGVSGMIASGYHGGDFLGGGIVTTQSSATGGNMLTSVGVAQNADLGYSSFGGVSVGSADTLVMYTYAGDANLDGVINGDDYFQIDSAFPQQLHGWFNGDFNYDGVINGDDYFTIDSNFPMQGAAFPVGSGVASASPVTRGVPEPLSLTAVFAASMLLRRRRRVYKFAR